MPRGIGKYILVLAGMVSMMLFSGCAGQKYLAVDYQLPTASHQLKGQMVRLQVEEMRQGGSILSPDAADQFPDFSGLYSLAWIMPDQARIQAGEHQLIGLFRTVFERRLAGQDIGLAEAADTTAPLLTIVVKQFSLDLRNHKWMVDISYDAVLISKDHPISRENVHGSAERVRIIGRKGAEKVLGEIFSDVVNRLDLTKLFRNAKLIP